MRAHIFGRLEFEGSPGPVRLPKGPVRDLLRWLLLHPNELQSRERLVQVLWPDEPDLDPETGRERLYVVVSRLRRFLTEDGQHTDGPEAGLRLTTDRGGYRLVAASDDLDRVAFESASGADPAAVMAALDLWTGVPYADFPPSPERDEQRARLEARRRELADALPGHDAFDPGVVDFDDARTTSVAPAPDVSATWQRRLCDRIGPAGEHAFVVVDAPAGCGKSALLASWAAEQRGPVVWLSLEPGDNEPIRFWSMARRAIDASGAQVRRADVDGNVPGTRAYVDAIVAALARSDGPTAIVVDDAHHVVNPRVIRTALDAIWRVNRRITIVVGTRIPAPADTAERFARLGWCHLGSDDLRLTTDEVAEIVDQLGSPADAGDLHAATDGWAIAAVHGARSAMYRTDVDEPRSDMTDYVRHEVLDALPDRLRDLVLRTAHLPWLSAELCAAVTGDADTPTSLAALADRRLLRPLPGHTGWYRCLGVVRDACIEIARHDDTIDVRRLHRSTAEWWHLRGRTDLALDHAIAGDDRVLVPQLAGDVLMAAFSRSAAYTCRQLLGELDPDVVAADRRSLDVATCLAGLLLDPPGAERWSFARRAIVSEPDPISMCVRIHRAYLDGRAGESVRLARATKGTLGPYFDEHGGHPDLRRVIARVLDVADFAGRVLGGRLRHADTTSGHAPPTGHFDSWSIRARLVGETAFLAVVDGDVDAALAMLATFDSDPSDVDAPIPLGAVRLVATEAIITLMTTDDEAAARSAIDRLDPLAAALWDLRWHVELIPVYLALSMAHQRVGDPLAASRRIDDVDVLLAMCEDADLMIRARSLLDTSFATHDADTVAVDALTEGERRVVDLVSDGLSNRDVAARLDVSPLTVAGHMQSAFRKLGVRSRHGAVMRVRAHRRLRR